MGFYSRLGVHPSFDPSHKFVTSPFLRSPIALALVRVGVALYTLLVLLVTLIWTAVKLHDGQRHVLVLCSHPLSKSLSNHPSATFPTLLTSLTSVYVPTTGPQVLKQSLTPLDGGS